MYVHVQQYTIKTVHFYLLLKFVNDKFHYTSTLLYIERRLLASVKSQPTKPLLNQFAILPDKNPVIFALCLPKIAGERGKIIIS